ncbi:translation initiation factor IF-2, putative [Babesia ovata]|uniref:Translation initiation factor IF-2, putative n=1 Tax=Babesia ovata TaxID=189622 RepID=A0A2H6KG14_9APIC|nr:translation initiation factor IF-2, putative [Babesia ovata]GBE61938.1 translation initiation factor IF-2, putative [Babesia ovata]
MDGGQPSLGFLRLQRMEVVGAAVAVRNHQSGVCGVAQRPDELLGRLDIPHAGVHLVVVHRDEVAHPDVLQRLEHAYARCRVRLKHLHNQVLGASGHRIPLVPVEMNAVVPTQVEGLRQQLVRAAQRREAEVRQLDRRCLAFVGE